ncbi:MAG: 2-phosphosulfolactate phosphatase [Bacteroidales bacterium]|nr:2-phosphosulfolactate phosphatase [Bacteroidales bacterium]
MNISVIPTAQQAQGLDFSGKTAVVIDVLRATSVITTALANGAQCVVPVKTVEEAQSLFVASDAATTLRGGERNALKIDGFELDNSPLEYTKERVGGKTVILTTTNGTNAINNVKGADEVVLACFRNAAAVVDYLLRLLPCDSPTADHVGLSYHGSRNVVIVCSGTEGCFSMDDGLCAGMLIASLRQKTEVETDDFGGLLSWFYIQNKDDLRKTLSGCFHLKRLISMGFSNDVGFCLEANVASTVPVVSGKEVIGFQ